MTDANQTPTMDRKTTMDPNAFFAKSIRGEIPLPPIAKLLGWRLLDVDAEAGTLRVEMQATPEFLNPGGTVHGGMMAAMLDETLSPTLAATLKEGEFCPTLELKVNFIACTGPGPIIGEGRIVSKGKSICFLEGRLLDGKGKLLATASATSKIIVPR